MIDNPTPTGNDGSVESESTTDQLLVAIRNAAGRPDIGWAEPPRPLRGGFWAEIWQVRLDRGPLASGPLVARVMPNPVVAARETAVQAHLASAGFPTPAVRLSAPPGPDLDRAWMLMDLAPGAPLLDGLSGPRAIAGLPRNARALPDQLASHAAHLHTIDPAPLRKRLGAEVDTGDEVGDQLAGIRAQAESVGAATIVAAIDRVANRRPADDTVVICHGDLHPFNILAHRRGDTVLDWSSALLAHPAHDLAYTRLLLANPPIPAPAPLRPFIVAAGRSLARRFVATYHRRSGRSVPDRLVEWHTDLHGLRILTEIATWRAAGELDRRSDHPFVGLIDLLEGRLLDSNST